MCESNLNFLAEEMAQAYVDCETQGEAVEKVKDIFHDADVNILWAMWTAISEYDFKIKERANIGPI